MKMIGGVIAPSSGAIHIDGIERAALTVAESIAAGIAFVHQELNLFDNLDAAANVFIGREPLWGGPLKLIDRRKLHRLAQPFLDALGVDFKPDTLVSELSIAQRQLLEIAKALSLNSRVVIMDEPTSSLTLAETGSPHAGHRGSKVEGRERYFHLSPPQRTRPNCGPRDRAARRQTGRRTCQAGHHAFGDDPHDDRARSQGSLRASPPRPRRERSGDRRCAHGRLSRNGRFP